MQRNLYKVERPIYSFDELRKDYPEENPSFNMITSMKNKKICKVPALSTILRILFPLPYLLSTYYTLKFLVFDIMSGFTMVVFHIPQGLAYGLLSGLQPVNGLYASFFPPLIYALFGTSRQLSLGTFAIMALLSSVPVLRETKLPLFTTVNTTMNSSANNEEYAAYELSKLQISISTTLLAGIIQVILGVCQFGCLMSYMSDAMIDGFTSAAAVHVVMSQLSHMLGYPINSFFGVGELPYKAYLYFKHIKEIHLTTVIISIICIVVLVVFTEYINPIVKRKLRFHIPIQFVVVVVSTLISYCVNLNERYNVKIVGPIPKGLPIPIIPEIIHWPKILADAILLALIGFVMNSSMVKVYALQLVYDVDYNQEAIAYGLANIVGAFFLSTISAAALARTAVVVEVGMKSQLASLISCLLMLLIILFIGPLFVSVPTAVLSAIIIVSLKSMLQSVINLPKLWYLSKYDFSVWIVTYASTLFLNVPFGLVFGFIFSLLTILIRIQNPKSHILGQLPKTDIYKSIKIFKSAQEIQGIKIFRYDAPLYFANSEHFQSKVYKKTGVNPNNIISVKPSEDEKVTPEAITENHILMENGIKCVYAEAIEGNFSPNDLKFVIIDLSGTNYIDNVGIRILEDIYTSYNKIDIRVYLASLNKCCRDMLERAKFAKENRDRISFVTVHDAVLAAMVLES